MHRPTVLVFLLATTATAAAQPAPATAPATAPEPEPEAAVVEAAAASDEGVAPDDADPPSVTFGGYIQPQFRYVQNDDQAQSDDDGFRVRRARLIAGAYKRAAGIDYTATVEAELAPEFQLLDAYGTARARLPAGVGLALDIGQVKTPFSRQELLGDANLAFVDKAAIASLAPDRQIGGRLAVDAPVGPVWARLTGGIFNGDGRNQPENIDENYLFAGRLEVGYGDRTRKLAESDLDGATYAVIAGSVGHNNIVDGMGRDKQILFGTDVAVGWHGASAVFEYLEVRHFFLNTTRSDYHANGFAAQANYILPLPLCDRGQLEVGVRVEEIDRNDTTPITAPGDPEQSLRNITGVVSYYQRGHSLKAQLAYTHTTEVEDVDSNGRDATFGNDTAVLQLTYRME